MSDFLVALPAPPFQLALTGYPTLSQYSLSAQSRSWHIQLYSHVTVGSHLALYAKVVVIGKAGVALTYGLLKLEKKEEKSYKEWEG